MSILSLHGRAGYRLDLVTWYQMLQGSGSEGRDGRTHVELNLLDCLAAACHCLSFQTHAAPLATVLAESVGTAIPSTPACECPID